MAVLSEPLSRYLLSHRLRLHAWDWGNEHAPPLILLHGGNDHGRSWDDVARRLAEDFHVIAPDLRGHGDSEWAADGHYTLTAHVIDLAETIRQTGPAPVSIVAHSYGARVALRTTALFPEMVARLVAIEGLFDLATDTPPAQRIRDHYDRQRALAARAPRPYATIEEAAARMRTANPRLSPDLALHLARHGTRQGEDGLHRWKFDPLAGPRAPIDLTPQEETSLLAGIACPVLFVQGRESRAADQAHHPLIARLANARVQSFDGAGHWVQHDRLDAFVDAARAFLRGA